MEDTTTTNTTKTISMVTEGESSLDGVYIGDVEEDDDIILPAITVGGGVDSTLARNDAHLGKLCNLLGIKLLFLASLFF